MPKKMTYSDEDFDFNLNKSNRRIAKNKKKRIRKPKKIWSQDEDELLLKLIDQYGPAKWSVISSFMENRQGK